MMRHAALLLVGLISVGAGSALAADEKQLQALLEEEIVGSQQGVLDVRRFCEARVPPMPKVSTAAEWEAEAVRLRKAVLRQIVYRGEAARWRDAKTKVQWLDAAAGGPGYRIKKLRYEALPGLWIPALLYEPEKLEGKVPAILNVNGHSAEGKAYVPKQIRCINQAKRGMLALNLEWLGMGQLRIDDFGHYKMNQLDLCGTSGLAPFYLAMKRGLDILLSLEHADPARVAVTGLSGGGWQTCFISALDERVTLSNAVAGYSGFRTRAMFTSDLGDSEQTPNDLATVADYTHLTAMRAPRPTLLTYNIKDNCCFASGHALPPLLEAAGPIFKLFGKEKALRQHVNHQPGTHNYELDNRQVFYRMLGDFFYPGSKDFDAKEIPSQDEVKSKEQLHVEMPEKNENFHTLAMGLIGRLPRRPELPKDKAAAGKWQQSRRDELREIVRAKDYEVEAVESGSRAAASVKARFWKLKIGRDWTVPAVELVQGDPKKTALVVADAGRRSAAAETARLLASGHRVLAVDPFYFGESKISQRDFLYALLVAAVGSRPLGLQASQVAAIARWSVARHKTGPLTLVALGPRSSTFSLVAAALETKAIGRLRLHGALGSLKEVVEQNWTVRQKPELFCFGLLEALDIKQIAALVAPRPLLLVDPSDRVKTELAGLAAWYGTLGSRFDPLCPSVSSAPSGPPAEGTVRVAGIVLKWLRTQKQRNYERLEPMVRQAAKAGAQIVCTTECFLDGYAIAEASLPLETYRALGEKIPGGEYFQKLTALADELNVHLVAGMMEADGQLRHNTAVLIGPDGKLIGKYRKQHLGHEAQRNTPGNESSVFPTPYGRLGMMICADRRFPKIVQGFCKNGAHLLICISGGMFGPKNNDPHLQARSRENGIHIVFVHPAEFLVTGPAGDILSRTILGDVLLIAAKEADGPKDSKRVFYFDLPRAKAG